MVGSRVALAVASFAVAVGLVFANGRPKGTPSATLVQSTFGQPHIGAVQGKLDMLKDVRVIDFGREVYRGEMDINPTIDRIRKGEKLNHRNDGGFFGNRERRLPRQNDRDYYREFVHTIRSPKFPGPQRVVIGKDGSVWYTGDHYDSFTKVTK
jgi:guanyl-specific ribonuclease Sa